MIRDETMLLRVHVSQSIEKKSHNELKRQLDSNILLTFGPEIPPEGNFAVLVAGRPEEALLTASSDLDTLIIPFAGVPVETAALVRKYPQIAVHNLHHNAAPVAELTIGLMLAAAKRLIPIDRSLRKHDWTPRWDETAMIELSGRTATILGYGAIGQRVAASCLALGMTVRAFRRQPQPDDPDYVRGLSRLTLVEALKESQVLLVTVPLTEETRGMIGPVELSKLPDSAIVVNIARGDVIEQAVLFAECASGRLRAGLDVWYNYPRTEEARTNTAPSDFPFESLDNVVMTPHMGGNSDREEIDWAKALAILLNARSQGRTIPNKVDLSRGY